jgi:ankyrin repeat protein
VFGDAGSWLFRQHHNDVIDLLLGKGASFLSPDYAGETPMDLLRRWAQDI